MRRSCLISGFLILTLRALAQAQNAAIDPLEQGFLDPPISARPLTWWHWVNGFITKEGITADLESMKRVGLGGAQIFTVDLNMVDSTGAAVKGPVKFLSSEWQELLRHALTEGKRLGLELSIMNCAGWGQAGGHHISPAQSMQKVVWTESQIVGGHKISLALPQPKAEENYYEDIALQAIPSAPGDEVRAPAITSSGTNTTPIHFNDREAPTVVLPLPMPETPQWLRLEFQGPVQFSSLRISMTRMRDTGDPDRWEGSAFLDEAGRKALSALPGPHHWELQVSRDEGKTFEAAAPIATHGTTSFPEISGRIFRIWMPVPPPLASELPLARTEKIEITGISFGGPRIDRADIRAAHSVDAEAREFSTPTTPNTNVPPADTVVMLTGKSEWDAPPGKWTLLRIGHTSTGATLAAANEGGLECDKLSRVAVSHHVQKGVLGTVLPQMEPFLGTTLKNILCDSWESCYENWTPLMREEFLKRRGYSMDPWLATLTGRVVESVDASERFLWDFRRTLADLVAENYYGTLQDFAHQYKMGVYAEATGHGPETTADGLQCKGRTDAPMGEFWVSRRDISDTKEAASAAHIYGKQIAAAESFTAIIAFGSWKSDPYSLKAEGDLQFCMGINRFCFHRYAHQPWSDRMPGMTMGTAGTEFDRMNTWWEQAKPWVSYLSRCQFLLQQGSFVADLCYFYGEDVPVGMSFGDLVPKVPEGYDFDICNTEILKQMKVRDGSVVVPCGMSYRVLVLPDRKRMTPGALSAVRDLVKAGATVVGPRPTKSPSLRGFPECDRTLTAMADELWADCDGKKVTSHTFGDGRVQWGGSLVQILGVPADFSTETPGLKFIHRRASHADIYFVSNQSGREVLAQCGFRVQGMIPEIWDPETGSREIPALVSNREGRTFVTLRLGSVDSLFVVFRKRGSFNPVASIKSEGKNLLATVASSRTGGLQTLPVQKGNKVVMTVSQTGTYSFSYSDGRKLAAAAGDLPPRFDIRGPWQVSFPPNLGAPALASLDQLSSWTSSSDDGIKYFSGTATYRKDFAVSKAWLRDGLKCYLDLGAVKNIAQVTLNGQDLGVLWKPPFRIEVTAVLKPENRLEIKVTNLWPNRLIGDVRHPEKKPITWTSYNPYRADSKLLDSGLLGPVTLQGAKVLEFPL